MPHVPRILSQALIFSLLVMTQSRMSTSVKFFISFPAVYIHNIWWIMEIHFSVSKTGSQLHVHR